MVTEMPALYPTTIGIGESTCQNYHSAANMKTCLVHAANSHVS